MLNQKKDTPKKKKIIIIASIVAILISISIFTVYALDSLNNVPATPPSSTVVSSAAQVASEPQSAPASSQPEVQEIEPDFAELQEQNADVYAFIEIPNTSIAFPILQHPTDNTYYLRRDIDGNHSIFGVIYTELYNSTDFTDSNTIIYGHDTLDGQMFGDLRYYYDEEFLLENDEIIIHTPEGESVYKIFSAIVYDDRHIAYTYDTTDSAKTLEFIETLKANADKDNSTFLEDVELTENSNIITLSTCYGSWTTERFLVSAVLQEG